MRIINFSTSTYAPLYRDSLTQTSLFSLESLRLLLRIRCFMRAVLSRPIPRIINLLTVNEAFSRFNTKRSQSSPRKFTFCPIESQSPSDRGKDALLAQSDRSSTPKRVLTFYLVFTPNFNINPVEFSGGCNRFALISGIIIEYTSQSLHRKQR